MNLEIGRSHASLQARGGGWSATDTRRLLVGALFFYGTLLNVVAYKTLAPLFVLAVLAVLGLSLLALLRGGGVYERRIFVVVYAVCWLMAGIGAVYANVLGDAGQNESDPAFFYEMATSEYADWTFGYAGFRWEGKAATLLWKFAYDFFAFLGLEKGRYIGITVNILLVATTAVLILKTARLIFGNDARRMRLLIKLVALCGLFWLFAAIHLRDAFVLLLVTLLVYVWVYYLVKPSFVRGAIVGVSSLLSSALFPYVRSELFFAPLAMLLAGASAQLFFSEHRGYRKVIAYVLSVVALGLFAWFFSFMREDAVTALIIGREGYTEFAAMEAGSGSLGMRFIVQAPLPRRVVLGSAYLFVFPIPVWSGFQLESAYHLFKSYNALFFYAVIPLGILAVLRLLHFRGVAKPALVFLFFVVVGFTSGIAATSLETRHFGAFLAPFFILAVLPDLGAKRDLLAYRWLLAVFLMVIAAGHALWVAVKI
jgi:hypothetical protein